METWEKDPAQQKLIASFFRSILAADRAGLDNLQRAYEDDRLIPAARLAWDAFIALADYETFYLSAKDFLHEAGNMRDGWEFQRLEEVWSAGGYAVDLAGWYWRGEKGGTPHGPFNTEADASLDAAEA